jgi:hypothetical protein
MSPVSDPALVESSPLDVSAPLVADPEVVAADMHSPLSHARPGSQPPPAVHGQFSAPSTQSSGMHVPPIQSRPGSHPSPSVHMHHCAPTGHGSLVAEPVADASASPSDPAVSWFDPTVLLQAARNNRDDVRRNPIELRQR